MIIRKGQDDFADRQKVYTMKQSQAIYLFENIIIDNVFATLRGYSYNIENRNLKILMDFLIIILTKATTGSI